MQRPESSAIEAFIPTLPDPAGARSFLARLRSLEFAPKFDRDPDQQLLARLLTIAAYSPYLGETLLRHPEHIGWLEREAARGLDRVKSTEQLREEMARFLTGAVEPDLRANLARFKRRELLRIYLRDCLARATLAEVTDELSNLADVILGHALAVAHQEMFNRHGAPQIRDHRGRIEQAELAVVSLGKLGCRELNYASDIDLLFLYSTDGFTSGDGRDSETSISNKGFFAGVAERIVQLIGGNSDEGSVYRIDLRLRPYGRDGDTVWEIERASDYYREKAQNWERQALIRTRASAGSERVVSRFVELVRDVVFAPDAVPGAVASVRRAKEKIDRSVASRGGGFNVKLGRGGIREIEFIAQALQLARGGREPWVRSAQTLIVLGRLAEKHYLSETECARLSAAYEFLRKVEHRLQMEHGAQTHRLPAARARLEVLARRCGYRQTDDPSELFLADLEAHTSSVRAVYDRVFATAVESDEATARERVGEVASPASEPDEEIGRLVRRANIALNKLIETRGEATSGSSSSRGVIEEAIKSALPSTINPPRALRNLTAWADSLATYHRDLPSRPLAAPDWQALIKGLLAVLSSQYLSQMLVSRPALATVLVDPEDATGPSYPDRAIRAATDFENSPSAKTDALRRAWYRLVLKMGYRDMREISGQWSAVSGQWSVVSGQPGKTNGESLSPTARDSVLRASNVEQTALAEAVLSIAVEIALESMGLTPNHQSPTTDHRPLTTDLPFVILGLGRLGHSGMDYGSDLDLLVIFDDKAPWPPAFVASDSDGALLSPQAPHEFYAKLTSHLVRILSSITREGLLYRVDLRLRPEGKSGALAQGLTSLTGYLRTRASAWEHSAYLKAREVSGDLEFGARARTAICDACFDAARRNPALKEDLSAMRTRLEKEKASGSQRDIKWGRGGMTEVYFITRYIQLRDRIYFPTERGTTALIKHLGELGAIDESSTRVLFEGYWFLRRLDHWMRLLMDRARPVLPASAVAMGDIARALGLDSVEELERAVAQHTSAIRGVYERVFG
jgi:[glutamine synthetase] adenylyltransferase / [glutamine synthetase]-adenylyl-L-tyrosine phosphorylase